MMTVDTVRLCTVKAVEFLNLRRNKVFKRASQPRMKQYLGETVPQQIRRDFAQMLDQPDGAVTGCKLCRKIKMKTGVDSRFSSFFRSPLRVLHENHGTY